jgi:hypothetical protein
MEELAKEANNPELISELAHERAESTPEKLEDIIDHGKQFKPPGGEPNQLCCDLTAMSQRARQVNGRREDPNSLDSSMTWAMRYPLRFATRARMVPVTELQAGTKGIVACRRHITPRCACWKSARESLYTIPESFGERSPQSWVALRVWEALEEMNWRRGQSTRARDCGKLRATLLQFLSPPTPLD